MLHSLPFDVLLLILEFMHSDANRQTRLRLLLLNSSFGFLVNQTRTFTVDTIREKDLTLQTFDYLYPLLCKQSSPPWILSRMLYLYKYDKIPILINQFGLDPKVDNHRLFRDACKYGALEIAQQFYNSEMESDVVNLYGFISACEYGHTKLVRWLLTLDNLDPTAQEHAAFLAACKNERTDIVYMLLTDGRVDPTYAHNGGLQIACSLGFVPIFALLMGDQRVNPGAFGSVAFSSAIKGRNHNIIKTLLLDSRVDVSVNRNEGLLYFAGHGPADIFGLFLQRPEIDAAFGDDSPIVLAVHYNQIENVRLLLNQPRVSPDTRENLPLREARKFGYTEIETLLVQDPRIFDTGRVKKKPWYYKWICK